MTLRTLRVETMRSETTFLQPLFDDWKNRAARGIAVAGAPDWLLDIQVQNAKDRSFEAYGYSFEIDVLWRLQNERRVLELKNAAKYEPLALAEVLHHAYLLRECEPDEREIKSTIIARYHPWAKTRAGDGVRAPRLGRCRAGAPLLVTLLNEASVSVPRVALARSVTADTR